MIRCLHLRRPPVIAPVEEPFVPAADVTEVDRRWAALRDENPAYFDGRLCHVFGVHRNGCGGAVIHVADCAYRYHAVQTDDYDLGVRSLGVKAFTSHDDGRLLLGRRSQRVAANRGRWEFAPGGVVEPGRRPEDVIVTELREETTLRPQRGPTPIALLYDPTLRCWEIVYRIEAGDGAPAADPREYDELRWCAADDLPSQLAPVARQMVDLLPGRS